MLITIPLIATCACLGGDENIEEWNKLVDNANNYISDGNALLSDAEDAYSSGNYDIALNKANDASAEFDLALNELEDLRDVAEEMDNGFTEDYVDAWQSNLEANQSYLGNLKMLVLIDKFGAIYQGILDTQETAFDQMFDLMDQYNNDRYQQALATADIAYNSFTQLVTLSEDLDDVSTLIGEGYVTQYAGALKSLFTNYQSFIEYARLAASAAVSGDQATADDYVDQANVYYNDANSDQEIVNQLEEDHPGEFPLSGFPLNGLYSNYYALLQEDMEDIENYGEEMDEIQEDHEDFFEE